MRKSKSELVSEKLDEMNNQNMKMKAVLMTAITRMTELVIHQPPSQFNGCTPAEANGHANHLSCASNVNTQVTRPTVSNYHPLPRHRRTHTCDYKCAPHCVRMYDD